MQVKFQMSIQSTFSMITDTFFKIWVLNKKNKIEFKKNNKSEESWGYLSYFQIQYNLFMLIPITFSYKEKFFSDKGDLCVCVCVCVSD